MFKSIKTKIMVLQAGLILAVIVCLGVTSYLISLSTLKDCQKNTLKYFVTSTSERISDLISHKSLLFERIADSEAVANYVSRPNEIELEQYFLKYGGTFTQLSYANSSGKEEVKIVRGDSVSNYFNLSSSPAYRDGLKNPNRVITRYHNNSSDMASAYIEFGYFHENFPNENIYFISGRIPVSALIKDVNAFSKIKSNYAMLVDNAGEIIACPDKEWLFKRLRIGGRKSESIISGLNNLTPGYGRVEVFGKDSFVVCAPVHGQKWSVVAAVPYRSFIAKLNGLHNTIILLGLTISIIGFLSAVYIASDITEPIAKLLKSTSAIANGDFSQRVNIDSKDEMGRLADSFNKMTENLKKTMTSVVNLHREIGERQKAEKVQQSLNEKLERSIRNLTIANRELSEFAHVAAHDLKAPLRAIGSLAGIILNDYGSRLDEQGKYYLDTLTRRTDRLSELISGILNYSELGRATVFTNVNINDIIRQTIISMQIPDNIDITLESDFPTILGSKPHISQIFQNLIHNAVKFMDKPRGFIRVKCISQGDFWQFSVSDNGRGIDERYFDKIFKIFQTLVRRDEEENTGIGLSIVKRIVEKYNGKIWVESQPKVGSTFFFTLRKEKMEVNNEKLQTNSIS